MPLQGLYPPFLLSTTPGAGVTVVVVENLEVEYSQVVTYEIEYSTVSEIGP